MNTHPIRRGIQVIDGAFTADELAGFATGATGFEHQRLGRGRGHDSLPEHREHTAIEDTGIAALLWERLGAVVSPLCDWFEDGAMPGLEPAIGAWRAVSCNPRSRWYRYRIGDRFAPHRDEPPRPTERLRSFLTVLVYLPTAEPCVGGETVVGDEVVAAVPGRTLLFDHGLLHEGRPVERGEKLVLRNDILATSAPCF